MLKARVFCPAAAAFLPLFFGLAFARSVTILDPLSPFGLEVRRLFLIVLILAALIVVVVYGVLGWSVYRYRTRQEDFRVEHEASSLKGNERLEVIWTALPLLMVLFLFGVTVESLVNRVLPAGVYRVEVEARQYFWNFAYPEGFRTSNELVIPVGRRVDVVGTAADVLHAFWAPNLGPDVDLIPGQSTRTFLEAHRPGRYLGECNQLCGPGHARMLFRVIALPEAEYARFVRAAQAFKPAAATPLAQRGEVLFRQSCAVCHRVEGVSQGTVGPDLTLFGLRTTLGAGFLPNTRANLEAWIQNAPALKPGVRMPPFPNLTPQDLEALAAFLEGLKPRGLDFSPLPER